MLFQETSKIVAFLRAEIPTEDIAKNPVVVHPHNSSRLVPERLPPATIKELSVLEPAKAVRATTEEWIAILAAIAVCSFFWHPALYVVAVVLIGSRQQALLILGHDASHYRYLPARWQNELFANLFLMWPTFASVEGFRKFHSTYHQYTNLPGGGNRHIWYTHDAAGELEPNWVFSQDQTGLGARVAAPRVVRHRHILDRPRPSGNGSHSIVTLDGRREDRVLFIGRRSLDLVRCLGRVLTLLNRAVLHLAHCGSVHPHHLRA